MRLILVGNHRKVKPQECRISCGFTWEERMADDRLLASPGGRA